MCCPVMNGLPPPTNGAPPAGASTADDGLPPEVGEMAEACIRYVQAALSMTLDFQAETLPILDHYIATRRQELRTRPQSTGLVARVVGAYFGELVRRRIASFWHVPSDDPSSWEVRFEAVYLAFHPCEVAYDAINLGEDGQPAAQLLMDDEDREAVEARLAELPVVTDEEFFSLSTRLEVIDIAVDSIKARMMSSGLGEVAFSPQDYEED
jgi:hypothetical protein